MSFFLHLVISSAVPRLLGKVLDYNATKPSSNQTCPKSTYDMNYLLLIVIGGGISSFLRTTMLNRAQDGIASSLRAQLFKSLLIDRNVEWYQLDSQSEIKNKNTDDINNSNNNDKTKKTNQENDDNINTTTKNDKNNNEHESTLSSRSPSAIQSILMKDVETISSTITTTLANTFRSSCSIIFATKNMFDINRNLLSISIGIVPLIGSMAVILNKFVKKITSKYHAITEKAEEFATERIDHIAIVRTSNRQYDEVDHYNKMQTDARALSHKASLAKGMFMGFMFSSSSAALVWLFHIGGKSVSSGKMTFGELKTFATYTFMLGLGTSGLMKGLGQIMQGMVCAERIYDLISLAIDDNSGKIETNDKSAAEVDKNTTALNVEVDHDAVEKLSLSNVNFVYASDPSKLILKNISLSIKRGEVVAITGANGSGKSTIASLLVALYKPSSGIVTVDTEEEKVDLHLLDRKMQSSLVQLVPQNPVMFDMSIRENVTYANPNATENEIINALKAANCKFIAKLKDGINYNVGRNGCKLSGGQRQRLALARALLCDPTLLVLDEPNSSMDAEGDNAVCDAVRNCCSGDEINNKKRGLLLITHKVTSLGLADTIIVLKDGVIVEQGKYKDLVGNKDSALCHLMPDLQ